jgi:hypothetical protein
MRRVDPQQRLFTQKTEQLLAAPLRLRLTRGWDFFLFPRFRRSRHQRPPAVFS